MSPKIRLATRADVAEMLGIYSPFILNSATSFELTIPTEEAFWQRVEKVFVTSVWLVCEVEGTIAGYAYAGSHRERAAYAWNRELSVYISDQFQKMGIATALYGCIIDIILRQGYVNALAGITLPNEKSVRFHEKMGFQSVGIYQNVGYKFEQWWHVGWWEMLLQDLPVSPPPIIHWKDLQPTIETDCLRWEKKILR